MSSQENLAARLKTGAKLTACIGHHHHLPGSMAAASRARAKQRKWRVLVSIGLLLPALAAIIGIVAWTISIEVANSEPPIGAGRMSPSSLAQRRAERLEQQQMRHEEALLVAAKLAALRRSARDHQDKNVHIANQQVAPQQASQATEASSGRLKPVAAAIVAPAAPQQQQSQQVTTRRRAVAVDQSSRQQQQHHHQHQPNQQQQQPQQEHTVNATTKTKSESAIQEARDSGSLEEPTQNGGDSEAQQMQTTTASVESQPEVVTTTPTTLIGQDGPTDEQHDEQRHEPVERPKQNSRWLNSDRSNKSKGSLASASMQSHATIETVPTLSKKQTKSVKEILENLRASSSSKLAGQTKSSSLMSNKYTLLNTGETMKTSGTEQMTPDEPEEPQKAARQLQEDSMVAVAKQAVKMMKKSKFAKQKPTVVAVSDRNEQERADNQEDTQPTTSSVSEERQSTGNNGDDDDLSFEAIASAISTSLSHQSNHENRGLELGFSAPSDDTSTANHESADDEPDQFGSTDDQRPERPNKATRTPGEHVAEVIDHLVDRRKQQQQQQMVSESDTPLGGPQIVVVAPVGSSSLVKSARSLTKSDESKAMTSKSSQMNKKASEEPTKKVREPSKSTKPIGARLLGSQDAYSSNSSPGKFSERVEVIEDDDTSALLMKAGPSDSGEQEKEQERDETTADKQDQEEPKSGSPEAFAADFANIHVSSNAGEPRLRSPRHEVSPSQSFERYAPLQQHYNQQQSAKLYSAEQLIREAVLKSKSRPHQHQQLQQQQQQQQIKQVDATAQQQSQPHQSKKNDQQQPTTTTATTSTTTQASITKGPSSSTASTTTAATANEPQSAPTTDSQSAQRGQNNASRQQQEPQLKAENQQVSEEYGIQSVQVPMFTRQQHAQFVGQLAPKQSYHEHHHHNQQQQLQSQSIDTYQPMESQQRFQQVAGPNEIALNNQQAQVQQQYQQQEQLPVFADQEFNVPAHMAESVINQIQQSPSTVRGVLGGRSALFQAHAPGQVPIEQHQQPFNYAPNNNQQQHQQAMQTPLNGQQMAVASSSREPHVYMQHPQHLVQQWTQQQAALAADLMARLAANRRHQLEQQMQSRQMMANRNGGSSGSEDSIKGEKQQKTTGKQSILSSVSKVLRPKNLVQPMAEKAFNHLFSSFGQQAAAQQAEIDSASATEEDEQRSSASQPASAASVSSASAVAAPPATASAALSTQVATAAAIDNQQAMEALQGSASAPIATAAIPPGGQVPPVGSGSSGRAMRSLQIGASAPAGQQVRINDQEVQESYGQMPTYHMAGGDHYGGGGHDYHQPDHDKKSKGITFHFGGGPIGGGTQLITSPMGIFRHLMIPLLPNPRVNLNGKVVFGVVLEKNTAFGSPPKKKHKYWGR